MTQFSFEWILSLNSLCQKWGQVQTVFLGQIHSDEQAGIRLVNQKTGEVVFAYAVNKKNSLHGRQTAAEACAKHLKDVVGKP